MKNSPNAMRVLAAAGTILLLLVEQTYSLPIPNAVIQSATQSIQFNPNFSASWATYVTMTNAVKLQVTLDITNVNMTAWDTQGEMGYWVGIGFGKTVMKNSDIILCQYKYTGNSATDKFLCSDRNATGYSLPPLDAIDNVDDISTNFVMTTVGNLKTAQLTAVFERNLDT